MDTRAIITAGETLTTEFTSTVNDKDLVRAVACLANGDGGVLLIGVEDDGTVVGAAPRHGARTDPARVAALIQASTEPALAVDVVTEFLDDNEIIRIDVPQADPGPVGTKHGVFTRRVLDTTGNPACVPMTAHEIVSMGMVMRGQDFAAAVARGATSDDLDPREFDRFRRLCRAAGDDLGGLSDVDLLRALGLVPLSDPVSLGAILLFGTEDAVQRWIPYAEFLFQDLRSADTSTNVRIIAPLLRAAEALRELIDQRNSVTELMAGMHRVEIPLIPSITRREAVANALVHRDYAAVGPTTVQITRSEFVVTNPGGFPPGVTTKNILDQSRPRSPILVGAFKRAGLVDRTGKGVNDMFEQQLRAGRDDPDYSHSTAEAIVVTVLGRLVELGILESRGVGRSRRFHLTARFYDLAQDRNAYVRAKGADPLQQERMILDYVSAYGSINRSQASQLCQTTPVQARHILKRLVDDGRLTLQGERRGAHYVLSDTHQQQRSRTPRSP